MSNFTDSNGSQLLAVNVADTLVNGNFAHVGEIILGSSDPALFALEVAQHLLDFQDPTMCFDRVRRAIVTAKNERDIRENRPRIVRSIELDNITAL